LITSQGDNQLPTAVFPRLAKPSKDSKKLIEFTEHFFFKPFPWQQNVDYMLFMENEDGNLYDVGITVSRQNGKTQGVLWPFALFCAAVLGKKVVYSAHRGDVVQETFELFKMMCSKDFGDGELHKVTRKIRSAQGQEKITFKNGGVIKFYTRTRMGSIGTSNDIIIIDEAQYLTEEQMSAISPTTVASLLQPQMIYAGTSPNYDELGDPFRSIRDAAREGSTTSAWIEWTSDHIEEREGDVERLNPSYGLLITPNAIQKERERLSPETFATQHLNYWSDKAKSRKLFFPSDYSDTIDKGPPDSLGQHCYGVKVSSDGSMAALAEAAKDKDGEVYFQLVDYKNTGSGYKWIADYISERDVNAPVLLDGRSGCDAAIEKLSSAGVSENVKRIPMSDAAASASVFYGKIKDSSARHPKQPTLEAVMNASVKRAIGNYGGWGFWLEGGSPDVSIIDACGLAVYQASTVEEVEEQEVFAGWV